MCWLDNINHHRVHRVIDDNDDRTQVIGMHRNVYELPCPLSHSIKKMSSTPPHHKTSATIYNPTVMRGSEFLLIAISGTLLLLVVLMSTTFSLITATTTTTIRSGTNHNGEKEQPSPLFNSHSEQVNVEFQNYMKERLGDESSSSSSLSDDQEDVVQEDSSSSSSSCGPVCAIFCEYGHVLDERGCPTCACLTPPNTQPSDLQR